jgi:hypothetical protein
MSENFL